MREFLVTLLAGILATVLLASVAGCTRPCGDLGRAERMEKAHQGQHQ